MPDDGKSISEADTLRVAGREFNSRLIIGTGKYESYAQNADALRASGADLVAAVTAVDDAVGAAQRIGICDICQ